MARTLFHRTADQISLPQVLECLGDPTRLAIVARLAAAEGAGEELRCRDFLHLGSKSKLTYHFEKMRDAGVVTMTISGVSRFVALRRDALDQRFPRLLEAVIAAAETA